MKSEAFSSVNGQHWFMVLGESREGLAPLMVQIRGKDACPTMWAATCQLEGTAMLCYDVALDQTCLAY